MRVTVDWLKEFITFDWDSKKLVELLTMTGLEAAVLRDIEGLIPIELEITSNRSDWLSVLGVAREIAALKREKICEPEIKTYPKGNCDFSLKVEEKSVVRYFGIRVDKVRIKASPSWLRKRLIACGIRPINNVVDVTNYVMLLFGQPLHAFDFDKLKGGSVIVKYASPKQRILTLDGQERILQETDLIIADEDRPIAIAGIIGGANTEVTESTSRILLESAYFPRVSIRKTRQRLGINTEASYRFERGVDPEAVERAAFYAARLIEELSEGKLVNWQVHDSYKPEKLLIYLPHRKLEAISGIKIPSDEQVSILEGLGFNVEEYNDGLSVKVPSFRQDINLAEDLIEEVLRVYGYDKVKTEMPKIGDNSLRGEFAANSRIFQKLRFIFESRGFDEAITFSLISQKDKELFWPQDALLKVENTISQDYLFLRPEALPGLLSAVKLNLSYGNRNISLYEVYQSLTKTHLCNERYYLSAISSDDKQGIVFDKMRRVVEDLGEAQTLKIIRGKKGIFPFSYRIFINEQEVGFWAKVPKKICKLYGLKNTVFYLQLDVNKYMDIKTNEKKLYRKLSQFPAVERDISMWVDHTRFMHQDIVELIARADKDYLQDIKLIDVYHSSDGRLSYTYRLYFYSLDKTLREEEIEPVFDKIIDQLMKAGLIVRMTK